MYFTPSAISSFPRSLLIGKILHFHLISVIIDFGQSGKISRKAANVPRSILIVFPGVSHVRIMVVSLERAIFFNFKIGRPATGSTAKFE